MVRIEITVAPLTAAEVRKSVCLPTDPTDSIGRRIYDNLDAKISEVKIYTTKEIKIYPAQAASVGAASSTTPWAWGSWVELVPANTITSDFIILGIYYDQYYALSTYLRWLIQLGVGAAGAESPIASLAGVHYYASAAGYGHFPFYPLVVPRKAAANSRVAVRATDDKTAAYTHYVKIQYVELPL